MVSGVSTPYITEGVPVLPRAWYHQVVLDFTWNDVETEIVLRNLNGPVDEQLRLHDFYLKLREEYRAARPLSASSDTKTGAR
jgi:hypothetical protein